MKTIRRQQNKGLKILTNLPTTMKLLLMHIHTTFKSRYC